MRTAALVVMLVVVGAACAEAPPRGRVLTSSAPVAEIVTVDGHPITVWVKRPAASARGALLLVHGRTWSARPNFDLQVDGESLSLMDAAVDRGWAVYAVDLRGYGATPRDATGWLTPDRAVADVAAVLDWIASHGGAPGRPAALGWSMGSTVVQLVAQRHPDTLSAFIAYGYGFDPDEPIPPEEVPATPPREPNTPEAAASDFITPGSISPGAVAAYVRAALASDPIRVDWKDLLEWGALDANQVAVPTLLVQGAHDPGSTTAICAKLFTRLATADRAWVVLPGADHAAHLEVKDRFVAALFEFLERPR